MKQHNYSDSGCYPESDYPDLSVLTEVDSANVENTEHLSPEVLQKAKQLAELICVRTIDKQATPLRRVARAIGRRIPLTFNNPAIEAIREEEYTFHILGAVPIFGAEFQATKKPDGTKTFKLSTILGHRPYCENYIT